MAFVQAYSEKPLNSVDTTNVVSYPKSIYKYAHVLLLFHMQIGWEIQVHSMRNSFINIAKGSVETQKLCQIT